MDIAHDSFETFCCQIALHAIIEVKSFSARQAAKCLIEDLGQEYWHDRHVVTVWRKGTDPSLAEKYRVSTAWVPSFSARKIK